MGESSVPQANFEELCILPALRLFVMQNHESHYLNAFCSSMEWVCITSKWCHLPSLHRNRTNLIYFRVWTVVRQWVGLSACRTACAASRMKNVQLLNFLLLERGNTEPEQSTARISIAWCCVFCSWFSALGLFPFFFYSFREAEKAHLCALGRVSLLKVVVIVVSAHLTLRSITAIVLFLRYDEIEKGERRRR